METVLYVSRVESRGVDGEVMGVGDRWLRYVWGGGGGACDGEEAIKGDKGR